MKKLSLLIILFLMATWSMAQDNQAQVPDLSGINLPQAVALLNQNGLNVGELTPADAVGDMPPNTVVSQLVAPGSSVPQGTAIDLTIVLPANARLIYDDNDITMLNLTSGFMSMPSVVFRAIDGSNASYNISQLGGGLDAGDCFQLWSITRGNAKDVAGCGSTNWRTTTNADAHFWTHSSGATQFVVIDNGIQRTTCPAADAGAQDAPLTCEFYVAGGGAGNETTEFIYLAYTENALAIINKTTDKWMPTNQTTIYNYNPGLAVSGVGGVLGDTEILRDEHRVSPGDITRLAPGQCLVYTIQESGETDAPEACDVVAQRALTRDVVLWVADFEVESTMTGQTHKCPAATPGRLTRCIVGR